MAKGQQQGVGAITIWMIIFVALWLTSTVFLIVLYTGQEELNESNNRLRQENERLISSEENRSLAMIRDAQAGGPTAVGILESARSETALLATGDGSDGPEAARAKRAQLLDNIVNDGILPNAGAFQGVSLLEAATMLYEAHRAVHARMGELEKRLDELDAESTRLVDLNTKLKDDFDARAKQFSDELTKLEADRQADNTERDRRISRLVQEYDARREQADAELTAERQRKAVLKNDLAELRKRIEAQLEKMGGQASGPGELSTARVADGRILSAIPGDDIVYIDLGRAHHITLGIRFSVYSHNGGIPYDGRGKAQIEVVSTGEMSSECRVIRSSINEPILEGDWVANPIYDPNRVLSFIAVGEFDLDHDGQPDRDGMAMVESMVTAWGGTMTSELTAMTDFVILGAEPPRPSTKTREQGEEPSAREIARRKAWDHYSEVTASASNMAVPILPQELFLNYLGYATGLSQR